MAYDESGERQKAYNDSATRFLRDYLMPFAPELPELPEQVTFPWHYFCKDNPGLMELFNRFLREQHYELSEHQCSWACMMYRWIKLHPDDERNKEVLRDDTLPRL